MTKLTKSKIDALVIRSKDYFLWDSELPGFGIRVNSDARSSMFRLLSRDARVGHWKTPYNNRSQEIWGRMEPCKASQQHRPLVRSQVEKPVQDLHRLAIGAMSGDFDRPQRPVQVLLD